MLEPRCFTCRCYINSDLESPMAAYCRDCFPEMKATKTKKPAPSAESTRRNGEAQ